VINCWCAATAESPLLAIICRPAPPAEGPRASLPLNREVSRRVPADRLPTDPTPRKEIAGSRRPGGSAILDPVITGLVFRDYPR